MPAARHLLRPPHAAPAALLPRRPVLFRLSAPPRAVVTQAMLEMANATTPTTIAAAIGMGVIVAVQHRVPLSTPTAPLVKTELVAWIPTS